MINETVYLREDDKNITLTSYVPGPFGDVPHPPKPVMLVLPGGGYEFLSNREGEPVALRFAGEGFAPFVLMYSINEKAEFPRPLQDVTLAVLYIKEHAKEYNADPDRIFLIGFSAGGHLAACYGTEWNKAACSVPGMKRGDNRIAGVVPSYPVISTDKRYAHAGSLARMTGGKDDAETLRTCAPAENVDGDTVPMFIWHTANDDVVPIKNSFIMAEALSEHEIPFELHVFPRGSHGISLGTPEVANGNEYYEYTRASVWFDECVKWCKDIK